MEIVNKLTTNDCIRNSFSRVIADNFSIFSRHDVEFLTSCMTFADLNYTETVIGYTVTMIDESNNTIIELSVSYKNDSDDYIRDIFVDTFLRTCNIYTVISNGQVVLGETQFGRVEFKLNLNTTNNDAENLDT